MLKEQLPVVLSAVEPHPPVEPPKADPTSDTSAAVGTAAGLKLFSRKNSAETNQKSLSLTSGPPSVKPGCSMVVSPTASGPGLAENCLASVAAASRPKA